MMSIEERKCHKSLWQPPQHCILLRKYGHYPPNILKFEITEQGKREIKVGKASMNVRWNGTDHIGCGKNDTRSTQDCSKLT